MPTYNYTVAPPVSRLDPIAAALVQLWRLPPARPRSLTARGAPGVNKQEWSGILCTLDQSSDKPPGGAQGRRVVIPSAVARTKLASLKNMPLNASQDLTDHDRHTVVGVVQEAWIAGPRLMIAGLLYDKNEGPLVARIQANTSQLGLSWPKPNTRVTSRQLARSALSVNSSRFLPCGQIAVDGARTDLQGVHNLRHREATLR